MNVVSITKNKITAQPVTQESQEPLKLRALTPFIWVALVWGVFGMVLSGLLGEQFLQSLLWMLGLWTLCVLDLVALAKTIAAGIILMSDQAPEKKSALAVQALSWGSLKMIFLGVIGLVLWKASTVPTVALLSGIGTLLIVPLVGGFWWSQKELSHA